MRLVVLVLACGLVSVGRGEVQTLATDPTSGETHLRHHGTADGYYRGKKVIDTATKVADEE